MSLPVSPTSHLDAASVAPKLVKTASGEYSAASVAANPQLAAGMIKLKDGNYAMPIVTAAERSPSVQPALNALKLGG